MVSTNIIKNQSNQKIPAESQRPRRNPKLIPGVHDVIFNLLPHEAGKAFIFSFMATSYFSGELRLDSLIAPPFGRRMEANSSAASYRSFQVRMKCWMPACSLPSIRMMTSDIDATSLRVEEDTGISTSAAISANSVTA